MAERLRAAGHNRPQLEGAEELWRRLGTAAFEAGDRKPIGLKTVRKKTCNLTVEFAAQPSVTPPIVF
jgi:hypothetical protein